MTGCRVQFEGPIRWLVSRKTEDLHFNDLYQFLHGRGGLLKRRLLFRSQFNLEDLLDAARSEFDRDADKEAVDPVLAFEVGGARENFFSVVEDRVNHFHDRSRRRVVGAAGFQQVDDFRAAVPGAFDDLIELLLRHQLRHRNARDRSIARHRHHRVPMPAQNKPLDVLDGDVESLGDERPVARRVENACHANHAVFGEPAHPERRLRHSVQGIRHNDQDRVRGVFHRLLDGALDDLEVRFQQVIKSAIEKAVKYSTDSILIIVTNPLDAMAQTAFRVSGFSKNRVIGMAGILDTARYRTFIAEALNVSVQNVQGFVLGGHGDTMVPVPRYTTVAGIPVSELMPKQQLDQIIERTRNGGAEIVNLLKAGSAYYAPSAAIVEMIDAIFNDRKKILPCAAYLEGEYGINGLFVGVPVKLGARGIEQIIEIKLTPEEQAALQKSAAGVKELVEVIKV